MAYESATDVVKTDILVVGGGLGGIAAALTAAKLGHNVILTEETDWLGGQLTSQAVPMDEHPWMESFGCTRSYRALRNGIRDYYRKYYPLTEASRQDPFFTPGAALTTRLPCEPRVALAVLEDMLAPFRANGRIKVLLHHIAIAVDADRSNARSVTLRNLETGSHLEIVAPYILDATETGELLPLAGMAYVTGAESQAETGEPHAVTGPAQPLNMQAITFPYALEYLPPEDHTIEKPESYEFWRSYQADFETGLHFSWNPRSNARLEFFPEPESGRFSIWQFRRILYRHNFSPGFLRSDVSLINTMQNDYWLGPIFEISHEEAQKHLHMAKQLSLSHLYWLQTEAPRPDGGTGYPGLRLRPDIVGTGDGLSKYPYVRESRRIKAEFTILEQHVNLEARQEVHAAETFYDSVGIGCYRIDLHPTTNGNPSLNISSLPFQIPLGALLPIEVDNLLPANKNIGTTHITNGCYRLHSIEWNIGEVAGALASFSLSRGLIPRQIRNTSSHLEDFQNLLEHLGVELQWPRFEEGTSYYRWALTKKDWRWGETDRSRGTDGRMAP